MQLVPGILHVQCTRPHQKHFLHQALNLTVTNSYCLGDVFKFGWHQFDVEEGVMFNYVFGGIYKYVVCFK